MRSFAITLITVASGSMLLAQADSRTNTASCVATNSSAAQIGTTTNQAVLLAERTEKVRTECVKGRRMICGRVIKVLPEGLIVDSGYTALLKSPFTESWVTSSDAIVTRDAKSLEVNEPGSACIGPVLLTHFPKRPAVKLYDYVAIQGYPVGRHTYTSVPGVQKTVRKFSAGLDTAIAMNLESTQKRFEPPNNLK